MEDKQAIEVLMALLKKPDVTKIEKDAILAAVGVLSWTALAQSYAKARRAKQNKDN